MLRSLWNGRGVGLDLVKRRYLGGTAESFVYHEADPVMKLPDWAGADREVLVHRSLEDFVPVGMMKLNGALFNAPVRHDLMTEAVLWQRAKWRAGTASTKTRGEVHRTTKKPWPQKGTGKARHGAKSSPIWTGGGVSFGPKPRDFGFIMNRKAHRFALRSMLSMKYANGRLWVIETPELSCHKTKILKEALAHLRWRSALIIDDAPLGHWGVTWNLAMACNQVRNFQCMNYQGLNCFDMSNFNHLVLTQRAIAQLDSRFEAYAHKNLMY